MHTKLLCAALVAAGTCNALGQLTIFTDQAAWESAVNGAGYSAIEETFDGITILNMQPGGMRWSS
jgi:hypothetical protein